MNTKQKQWQLMCLGYYPGPIDNQWGRGCEKGTREYQKKNGLVADGLFGPATEQQSIKSIKALQRNIGMPESEIDGFGGPKTWEYINREEKVEEKSESPADFWSTIKYFKKSDFRCKCSRCVNSDPEPDHNLVRLLEHVREHFGRPLIVTSGYRCKAHNAEVGGSSGSKHMDGIAADFVIPGVSNKAVYEYIDKLAPKSCGLGIYNAHIHVDVRPERARWDSR